jgi:hypothetical protein
MGLQAVSEEVLYAVHTGHYSLEQHLAHLHVVRSTPKFKTLGLGYDLGHPWPFCQLGLQYRFIFAFARTPYGYIPMALFAVLQRLGEYLGPVLIVLEFTVCHFTKL